MHYENASSDQRYISKYISLWLLVAVSLVLMMILLGGITRLTGSGLSIVQWSPVSGVIPPLSSADWQNEFYAYQQSPEFKLINSDISITEFKKIFLIEYLHRLLGRITGIITIMPFILFYYYKLLNKSQTRSLLAVNLLMVLQGLAGWYMVKSGLNDVPHVSHYRLAIHLFLGMLIYQILVKELFSIKVIRIIHTSKCYIATNQVQTITNLNLIIIICLYFQIICGALVSGLDAGMIYNSFPCMGDSLIPEEVLNQEFNWSIFGNAACVQFIHRWIAKAIAIIMLYYTVLIGKLGVNMLNMSSTLSFVLVAIQVSTGIITLIFQVPILSALIHQIGAVLLLTSLLLTRSMLLTK